MIVHRPFSEFPLAEKKNTRTLLFAIDRAVVMLFLAKLWSLVLLHAFVCFCPFRTLLCVRTERGVEKSKLKCIVNGGKTTLIVHRQKPGSTFFTLEESLSCAQLLRNEAKAKKKNHSSGTFSVLPAISCTPPPPLTLPRYWLWIGDWIVDSSNFHRKRKAHLLIISLIFQSFKQFRLKVLQIVVNF